MRLDDLEELLGAVAVVARDEGVHVDVLDELVSLSISAVLGDSLAGLGGLLHKGALADALVHDGLLGALVEWVRLDDRDELLEGAGKLWLAELRSKAPLLEQLGGLGLLVIAGLGVGHVLLLRASLVGVDLVLVEGWAWMIRVQQVAAVVSRGDTGGGGVMDI